VAREHGQFALLGLPRVPADAHDVTAARRGVRLLEIVLGGVLGVRHDLHLDAVAAQVVEEQLGPRRPFGHETTGDGDDDVRVNLAVRDGIGELRDERRELRVDVELVRVRVLAFLLAREDLVDPVRGVLRGVEFALSLLFGFLLQGLGGSLGRLGGFFLSLGLGVLRSLELLLVLAAGGGEWGLEGSGIRVGRVEIGRGHRGG
jgi:hypothetical protein